MQLDLSKLSPMHRYKILHLLYSHVTTEQYHFKTELEGWKEDGSINSDAGKEMQGWADALGNLHEQILTILKSDAHKGG